MYLLTLGNADETMYNEQTLTCVSCDSAFAFTVYEQEEFARKGYTNKPGRCPQCREARRLAGISGPHPYFKTRRSEAAL